MDITKWKSVLVPIEVYTEIKKTAKAESKTNLISRSFSENQIGAFDFLNFLILHRKDYIFYSTKCKPNLFFKKQN